MVVKKLERVPGRTPHTRIISVARAGKAGRKVGVGLFNALLAGVRVGYTPSYGVPSQIRTPPIRLGGANTTMKAMHRETRVIAV